MPMYEYICGSCGHHVEVLQKMSDAALTRCPHCALDALEKLVSHSGFRLKGEGWYETDFKGGDAKRNLAADKPEALPDKSSESTKEKSGATVAANSPAPSTDTL